MEEFQKIQNNLIADIKTIQTKCILYLRSILLQTKNKEPLIAIDKPLCLRKTYIEPTFGAGLEFVIGYEVYSIFMDKNEVVINIYNPDDINTEAKTFIKIYLDELNIIDLLDICKAVEQHKYI